MCVLYTCTSYATFTFPTFLMINSYMLQGLRIATLSYHLTLRWASSGFKGQWEVTSYFFVTQMANNYGKHLYWERSGDLSVPFSCSCYSIYLHFRYIDWYISDTSVHTSCIICKMCIYLCWISKILIIHVCWILDILSQPSYNHVVVCHKTSYSYIHAGLLASILVMMNIRL